MSCFELMQAVYDKYFEDHWCAPEEFHVSRSFYSKLCEEASLRGSPVHNGVYCGYTLFIHTEPTLEECWVN